MAAVTFSRDPWCFHVGFQPVGLTGWKTGKHGCLFATVEIQHRYIPGLVMTDTVRHGFSMALIEIDGLPNLKMVDLSMAITSQMWCLALTLSHPSILGFR